MNDLPEEMARLAAGLENLERRVSALEQVRAAAAPAGRAPKQENKLAEAAAAIPSTGAAAGAFPVLGRAMLGIGGAYLLRAIAASSLGLRPLLAAAGIVYAILWLALAARARASAWLARTVYGCTSALILAPMLWELTLRFHVLSPVQAAGALAAFSAVAFGLAWKREAAQVAWIANAAAAALALTLAPAAHSVAPFAALLLLMALLAEIAAEFGFAGGIRVLTASAADAGVWIGIYIYANPQNTRLEYPALGTAALLAPALTLFLIFGGSTLRRTMLRKPITGFESAQATIAFLLAACSLLLFAPAGGAVALRIACFTLAAGLYTATFVLFAADGERRNYAVFATWSLALLLAGLWMTLKAPWLTASLSAAALAATIAGTRFNRLALEFHGAAYLLAAASAAGLPAFTGNALAGPMPAVSSLSVNLAAGCAVLSYAATHSRPGESWKAQVLHLFFAFVAAASAAALLVAGSTRLLALGIQPGAHHVALLRTLVLCALALVLAFAGARARRLELTRIGYMALALVAMKLVAEDLRHGHLEYSAGSIFVFAITLIAAPRVARGTAGLKRKAAE